jgi:hypothetical protein
MRRLSRDPPPRKRHYTVFMGKQVSRTTVARRGTLRIRLTPYNTIAFPRALRDAIPDLHGGRVLKLDAINAQASNTNLYGGRIHLNLAVCETGKLSGEFVVRVDLLPEAARTLAATLTRLADEVEARSGEAV